MNAFEFERKMQKITDSQIRTIGVVAVQSNESDVIDDSITKNMQGLTFLGTDIFDTSPFTDWNETGQFHENLKFAKDNDIEFSSSGKGAEAIFSAFSYEETIAPHAKTLSKTTLEKIRQSFINNLKSKI